MPAGRPTKYTPELVEQAWDYIENYEKKYDHAIPSAVGMARVLGLTTTTLYAWAKEEEKEFSDILQHCLDDQHLKLMNDGLRGDFNSNIVKLALGKHGYSDKTETKLDATVGLTELSDEELARRRQQLEQEYEQSERT